MNDWFYGLNDVQQGPVSQADLLQMLQSGQLPADNLVWKEGMADWVPANSVPALMRTAIAVDPQGGAPAVLGYGVADSVYGAPNAAVHYAGFWIRFAGSFIDGIVVGVFNGVLGAVEGGFIGAMVGPSQKAPLIAGAVGLVSGQIVAWLYFALLLSSSNQASLGMMAVGLRVTDLQGGRISFARATGRHFASVLSTLIAGLGYLMMLWSPRKQTLHDQMAGTLVLTK